MTKIVVDLDEVYELEEAARLLDIGIATLFRWMKNGKIIPLRLSNRTFIPKSEIERIKTNKDEMIPLNVLVHKSEIERLRKEASKEE